MDWDMPGFAGFETMVILRTQLPQVDIIALTVFESSYYKGALSAGADGFVCKARIDTELLRAIQRVATTKKEAPLH